MFKCKACSCKDDHINSLKKEIEFLKQLSLPTPVLPRINLEENFLLNGSASERPSEASLEEEKKAQEVQDEFDKILSGNYDNYSS
jgi:hypothetical protein